ALRPRLEEPPTAMPPEIVLMVPAFSCLSSLPSTTGVASLLSSLRAMNPANDIIDIINKNRTSHSLSELNNSPGLGCIALQYVEQSKENCSRNNTQNFDL
ncbi:hypothetical protein RJ639_029415, partial [Escallonia herrerae]